MSDEWKARIDRQEESAQSKRQQKDKKARIKEHEKSPEVVWQREQRKVDRLKCHVCGKTEAELRPFLRPRDSKELDFGAVVADSPAGYFRVTGQYLHPEPDALCHCDKCGNWVCNARCPEPHIYQGTCKKCGSKPVWWPFYRWNPF